MYKKVWMLICMAGLTTVLSGCEKSQDGTENQKEETQTKSVVENIEEVFLHAPEGKEIITDYKKFTAPQEDQSYHFDTDYQYYVTSTWGAAKMEDSYYVDENGLIMVLDSGTHAKHLLCAKPDCSHSNYTCSAVIPNDSGIAYYKGNLYSICNSEYIENAEKGIIKYSVVKTSLSGDTKDKEKDILKVAMADMNVSADGYTMGIRYIQHRGYLYYVYVAGNIVNNEEFYMNGSNCIYRIPLEGEGEPECILPLEKGSNSGHMFMTAEGSYIYFVMANEQAFGELYRYNTELDVVEKMNMGEIAAECYTVINGKILYKKTFDAKQLYLYDPMTDKEEMFADMLDMSKGDSWDIHRDNNRIYVYYTDTKAKEAFFIVLNLEGDYVQKMVLSNQFEEGSQLTLSFFAADESNVVCHIFGTEEYLYFEKSVIE